jgi:hypothetical protein
LWPRRNEISSIPIRVSPSNGSGAALASVTTRPAIAPAVRHAIRISSITAVLEVCITNQAT